MPQQAELEFIAAHLSAHGLLVVAAEGAGLPIVTYADPAPTPNRADGRAGQGIRAACLALRQGIAPEGGQPWQGKLFNLAETLDLAALQAGDWRQGWNGVWIHQGHGDEGRVVAGGYMDGARFFTRFAQYIVGVPEFRYGLIKTCHAAEIPAFMGGSLLQEMAAEASTMNWRPRLVGARAATWVPVSGPHFGRPLIAFESVVAAYASNAVTLAGARATPEEEVLLERARAKARALYYDGPAEALAEVARAPVAELDRLASGITAAFIEAAEFRADRVRAPVLNEKGLMMPPSGHSDANWYAVN